MQSASTAGPGAATPVVRLILGSEAVLVQRALAAAIAAALPRCGPPSFNLSEARAGESSAVGALAAARTLPMMADLRLVVVKDLETGTDTFFEELLRYLQTPSPSTLLVLAGTGFPAVKKGGKAWATHIQKAVAPVGEVTKLTTPDPGSWAQAAARERGVGLGASEARLLVELVGADLGRLEQEVEKLSLLLEPGQAVTAAVIQGATAPQAEAVVWELTSGVAARDPRRALAALHQLLEEGEAPHKLMALVLWQLRQVLRGLEMLRHGRTEDEVRSTLKLRGDVVAALRREMAGQPAGAAELLRRCAQAALAMNSTKAGDRASLEGLVLQLTRR